MFNGLWTVEFISTINRYGRGVLIINDGRLLGGDSGYYYTGTCEITESSINALITVIKHDPDSVSVFGSTSHLELTLNGEINENQFTAIGTIPNNPQAQIKVIGNKKEDI